MGPLPRAILIACLAGLKWLTWVTAALMLILLVVQQMRGDEAAAPAILGAGALGMAALGWLCGAASAWFEGAD